MNIKLPSIQKLKLRELNLSCGARKETIDILSLKQNINGFKFSTRDKRCVAVGQFSGNDFDLWDFAAKVEQLMSSRGRPAPEKYRFVFIAA